MAFNLVMKALRDLLQADATLSSYVDSSQFLIGFHEGYPLQNYTIVLEPDPENERDDRQTGDGRKEIEYTINVHGRVGGVSSSYETFVVGDSDNSIKGILEVMDDIKAAIRADMTLGYNRPASSVSSAQAGPFNLSNSQKNLSILINSLTRSGYDTIFCGDSSLTGAQVATNIQSSLRALGKYTEDGYYGAICTFDDTTDQFTIETDGCHPDWSVVVTAGASDDCSTLLGFNSPTEVTGRNIVEIEFRQSYPVNTYFPIRYRVLPVVVREEITII
jgi:hypothetical protein